MELASQNVIDAFNEQIGHELGASHQYLSIAAYFESEDLPELASFFFRQSEEEREHAMKFVRFLLEVDGDIEIPDIAAPPPPSSFDSALACADAAVEWEEKVTQQIYDLVDVATEDSNHIALRFLDWFVTEQLEEVSTMRTLANVLRRAGEDRLMEVEEYLMEQDIVAEDPIEE